MFENITYESILQDMLDRVPDTVDKREGSVIYDALAPAATELKIAYLAFDTLLGETFADTASMEFLMRRAAERGITPYPASRAVLKAVATPADSNIEIGSRFSLNDLNYQVTEKIAGAEGEYKVKCETAGTIGNSYFGNLIPIDYVDRLQRLEITELLIPGVNEEDVEELRERYFESISSQAYGGNIADYREKTKGLEGVSVGGVKVTPVWNGGGTVKVTFVDGAFGVPSDELVALVQEGLDPVANQGQGYGVAPIGHIVTVEGAEGVTVNIVASITYKEGWSWDSAASQIKDAVDGYLNELARGWDETNDTALIVRISYLESRILQCDGVVDISGTKLNGSETNLSLTKYQIPVRGTINGN
jgi:uncharacterized phage protein gp47/JayE